MENVSDFLKKVSDFQDFVSNRGYELLMAVGCPFDLYTTPTEFQVSENNVYMTFCERTNSDCPEYRSLSLEIREIEMNEQEWSSYIEVKKQVAIEEKWKKDFAEQERKIEAKRQQYEELGRQLGYLDYKK